MNDNATSPGTTKSGYGHQLIKSPDINTVVLKKLRGTEKENKNGTGRTLTQDSKTVTFRGKTELMPV